MTEEYMLYVWIGLFVLFLITEAATAQLTTIWFACGALVALILEICGVHSVLLQIFVFTLVSVLVLLATRPLVRKIVNKRKEPTNADRNIGCQAVVTDEIDNLKQTGAVKLNGNTWTARSLDGSVIPTDCIVVVHQIDGVKVIVTPI